MALAAQLMATRIEETFMNTPTSKPANNVRRIQTLEEHRAALKHVFDTAKERVLIVSPFISSSALSADKIPSMVKNAVRRNVEVIVYIDDNLNREPSGRLKVAAKVGAMMLAQSGAKVSIVKGIHHKTLGRDSNLIAEGSFNWLSAVRKAGADHQREERTMIVEGDSVAAMIEKELVGLLCQEVSRTSPPRAVKVWRGSTGLWLVALVVCFCSLANITTFPGWSVVGTMLSVWFMSYMWKGVTQIISETGNFTDWALDGGGTDLSYREEDNIKSQSQDVDNTNYHVTIGACGPHFHQTDMRLP